MRATRWTPQPLMWKCCTSMKKKINFQGTIMKVFLLRTGTAIFPMKVKMQTHTTADSGVRGKHLRVEWTGSTLQPKPQQLTPRLSVTQSPAQPLDTHLFSALDSPMALSNKRDVSLVCTVLRERAHSSRGSPTLPWIQLLLEAPDWSAFTSPPPATGFLHFEET